MRLFTTIMLLFVSFLSYSQQPEDFIPNSAISVFTINSGQVLQKISLDDLVKYDFMEDVQQELFDGSTSGKTLKESGINFDQKFNIFFGKGEKYEISGFTFGISSEDQLFEVFDDFEQQKSDYEGTEWYNSYFNHLIIKDKVGIMIRVSANYRIVRDFADSIWVTRGNKSSYYNDWYYNEGFDYIEEEVVEFTEEMEVETEENTSSPAQNEELPVAEEDPSQKTYFELRDSVEMVFNSVFLKEVLDDLLIAKNNRKKTTPILAKQLMREADGVFYFDNSKYNRHGSYSYRRPFYTNIYAFVDELYEENTIVGDIQINDGSIDLNVDANYNNKLGAIYEELSDAKFDKNVLKYIHKDNQGFFTYNIDVKKAYEKTVEIVMPILEETEGHKAMEWLILMDLFDEFANKDAIFKTYKGSMFGTFNGIKKVKTTKITYDYDEENFESTRKEVESEEDMPIFTFGFSTKNNAFSEKILKRIERLSRKEIYAKNGIWVVERGAMNSSDLYYILKNDLFIITNDEDLAMNHSEGYGKESLGKTLSKKAKKSKFLYGYSDLGKAIEELPRDLFSSRDNEILDAIKGKSGQVELSSTGIDTDKASFKMSYTFDGENEDVATYVLDLINSLYVNSK
ncbi:MAG: hypothetical protein COA33_004110 [Fluviicola sp.]|nr:hypothetical protein [Fluviicola sp.]